MENVFPYDEGTRSVRSQKITSVIKIHPVGEIDECTDSRGVLSSSC